MLLRSWRSAANPCLDDGMNKSDMSVRTARFAAVLLGASLLGVLVAPQAGAQDPYGSTTTTAPVEEVVATCSLSVSEAKPGAEVTAVVAGVFFGEHVWILFDGLQVGEATAPLAPVGGINANLPSTGAVVAQSVGSPVVFQAATDSTTVTIKFVVPKAAAGTHIVTAVGDTFTCFCNPNGEFKVLATANGGSLVRTGIEAALLVVIAVALLLVGRALVEASRRRRSDAAVEEDDDRTLTTVGR